LTDEVRKYTAETIAKLVRQKEGLEIIELNVQSDHVHVVMWIPPKYSVANVMGYVKGKLAIRVLQKYEKLRKKYWGRRFWSRGYCVSTIGIDEERIREYVRWQEKKEREMEQLQGELFDEEED
jgi:putative transposase